MYTRLFESLKARILKNKPPKVKRSISLPSTIYLISCTDFLEAFFHARERTFFLFNFDTVLTTSAANHHDSVLKRFNC